MGASRDGSRRRDGSLEADGSNSPRRAPLDMHVSGGAWSPNGWPLIFIPGSLTYPTPKGAKANPDLWRLDGLDAEPHRILTQQGTESSPAFAPDGGQIRRINPGGGGAETLHTLPENWIRALKWSPRGQPLAYTARPMIEPS